MEVAGLSLAVLSEARLLATNIITRIALFKRAPARLAAVCSSITRLVVNVDAITEIGARNYSSFPPEIFPLFHVSLCSVLDRLFGMKNKLEEHQANTASGATRFFWARWCSESLSAIEQDAKEAGAEVQHILGLVTSILIGKRMENSLLASTCRAALSSPSVHPAIV